MCGCHCGIEWRTVFAIGWWTVSATAVTSCKIVLATAAAAISRKSVTAAICRAVIPVTAATSWIVVTVTAAISYDGIDDYLTTVIGWTVDNCLGDY